MLSHWAAMQDLFVRDPAPRRVAGDDGRDYYLWTFDNETESPIHVTISEMELAQNVSVERRMLDLIKARIESARITARNSK